MYAASEDKDGQMIFVIQQLKQLVLEIPAVQMQDTMQYAALYLFHGRQLFQRI